jgi:hypothetical protein
VDSTQDADGKNSLHTEKHIHLYLYCQTYYKQSHESSIDFFFLFKGTEVVKGLTLDVRRSEDKSLSTRSFTKMKLLKLLQINGAELTGSFERLSKVLTWICWLECPLEFLPSDFSLDYVVVIDMQYSNIRELWKKKKVRNIPKCSKICLKNF